MGYDIYLDINDSFSKPSVEKWPVVSIESDALQYVTI